MKNEDDSTAQLPEQQEDKKEQKKGRRLKIWLFLLMLCFVFLTGTLTGLASLIFSEHRKIPVQPLTVSELHLQQKMTLRLTRELFRKRPSVISQIVFQSAEIKSLFNLADASLTAAKIAGKYRGINLRELEPEFGAGEITLVYPIDTKCSWLFGGVLRLKMTGTPCFVNKKLLVEVKKCHLGRLPLPRILMQKILNLYLVKLQNSKDFIYYADIVKEIRLNPDGSWTVVYYPSKLSKLLF